MEKLIPVLRKTKRNIWLERNDQCWCGSGKKYKKCHMTDDELLRQKHKRAVFPVKA
jgi:uncharacterized protein YecA (UPF0149 family)